MDSPRTYVPAAIITIILMLYYRFYSKKPKKLSEKSISHLEKEELKIKEENIDPNKISEQKEYEEEEKEEEEEIKEEEPKTNLNITSNLLFDKFCEFIQKNKLVSIEAMAEKLNKSKEDTIKFLRELEKEGKTQGFLGDDGEYFFLTMKELDLLNNILIDSKKNKITEEELQKQFDEIIKERDDLIH